jgi:SAM-dependent methyltransferase
VIFAASWQYNGFRMGTPAKIDLYNNAYCNYGDDVYREIRLETYGEDLGQTSWVTTEESNQIPQLLKLTPDAYVFEVGCGSGRYALKVAEMTGCRMLGVDVNSAAIATANQLAISRGVHRVRFEVCDVSQSLPFPDATFDAVFSNDVLCHIPGRAALLGELFRVLKPGTRLLFSDALIIGGAITHAEIAVRSSIGYYLFSPPGENERLLQQAGFEIVSVDDTSGSAAAIAERWRNGRAKREDALRAIEGGENFEGVQRFLACVHVLTRQRRLLRRLYSAQKPVGRLSRDSRPNRGGSPNGTRN